MHRIAGEENRLAGITMHGLTEVSSESDSIVHMNADTCTELSISHVRFQKRWDQAQLERDPTAFFAEQFHTGELGEATSAAFVSASKCIAQQLPASAGGSSRAGQYDIPALRACVRKNWVPLKIQPKEESKEDKEEEQEEAMVDVLEGAF